MKLFERKLPTLLALLLLIGIVVGGYFYIQSRKTEISSEIVPQKVKITNVADSKFSVSWVTTGESGGSVEYGKVGEALKQKAQDERDTTAVGKYLTHQVTLTELQPGTAYSFRILSGDKSVRFDNNGSPYTTTTGPVIANTPPAKSFYGSVKPGVKSVPDGAIVYLTLPGSAPVSTLVRNSGTYTFSLSTVRSADLKSYITYDPSASVVSTLIESGKEQSSVSVSTANMAPVPDITLGQNADFRNLGATPSIAEVDSQVATPSATLQPTTPAIFNVEPLTDSSVNAITSTGLTILNPAKEGETLATLRPEFRGTAPAGSTLSIALTGQKAISDTTSVASDGTWSWAPVIDLKVGKQTITVSYLATGGTTQKASRGFSIATASTSNDPAFVSSPSASTKASASPKAASASATPRAAMPATDSGVPTTGVIGPTLLTGIVGIVIMILGATLLAL